jgi:hypothetical protein
MSSCTEFQARIPDLQELRPEELSDLERHTTTCRDCAAKLEEHRRLMTALRTLEAPLHVDGERLTRFAIHRAAPSEPDYDLVRLSGREVQRIEGHVSECPRCRLAVESIVEQYREIDRLLGEAGIPPVPIVRPSLWVLVRDELERALLRAKNALISTPSFPTAFVALGVVLIAIVWMGPWLRDPYHELAFVEVTEASFLTRDSGSALTQGMTLMNEGRYSEALALLEQFSDSESSQSSQSDERLLSYAHYLSGLAWVYEAKSEVFGRVLSYSDARLDRAIAHLESVTRSGQTGRVQEDAYWLLGKAHLMKKDPHRAVEAFSEVEQLHGRHSGEARQMILAIESLEAR